MIINACKLRREQQLEVAKKISSLSKRENSSLIKKELSDILAAIKEKMLFVWLNNQQPVFSVAIEDTGYTNWYEIGMVSNLDFQSTKGRIVFPQMIRSLKNNSISYLTTTNVKMVRLAKKAGFKKMESFDEMPRKVRSFCCSPCPVKKTGVEVFGEQKKFCPRFMGNFIPQKGPECTRIACTIMVLK